MDSRRPIKWGICGAGKISSDFCACLASLPRDHHQVVAVAGRSLDRAKQFATRFSIPRAYGCYEELAQDTEVTVVYVANLNPSHFDCCMKMFEYNKHVLCEKPLTMNADLAKKLVETARSKKLFLMEALWTRFFPSTIKFKEMLSNGTIGEVKLLKASFGISIGRVERLFNKELGGGCTLDPGIYPIAMASLVFGGGRPESVLASGYLTDTGVDELASVILKYPGNRVAQLCYSINLTMDNDAHAYGDGGMLTLAEPFWCSTQLKTPSGDLNFSLPEVDTDLVFSNSQGLVYEAEAVRKCIIDGKTECDSMPLDETIVIAEIMDSIMKQLGVEH